MKKSVTNPNRFCFAEHVVASRSGNGWNALKTDGTTISMGDAEFARRSFAIDCESGDDGFYALLDSFREHSSFGYRVDSDAGLVWLENGCTPVAIHDFLMTAVRADAKGLPVCSFLSSAEDQLYACEEVGAQGHAAEILGGTTAYGRSLVLDWLEAAAARKTPLDNEHMMSMVA
ncbi:hypothetical protein G6L37_04245 [Agrobacterium rubi]|nr:hypothetical protein [Agrobacterium rubi]NTF24562.1 hypothetical protein [Agrobacterium rubi]